MLKCIKFDTQIFILLLLLFLMYSLQLFGYLFVWSVIIVLKMYVHRLFIVKNCFLFLFLFSFSLFLFVYSVYLFSLFVCLFIYSLCSTLFLNNKKCICRDSNPDLHLGRVEFCPQTTNAYNIFLFSIFLMMHRYTIFVFFLSSFYTIHFTLIIHLFIYLFIYLYISPFPCKFFFFA